MRKAQKESGHKSACFLFIAKNDFSLALLLESGSFLVNMHKSICIILDCALILSVIK